MTSKEEQLIQLNKAGFICHNRNADGAIWYVEFHYNGCRYQKYASTRDGAVAIVWEQVATGIIQKIITGESTDDDGD